ncbi:MAG: L,D-transpeptidase [Cellulosilyticaceae bacterium]
MKKFKYFMIVLGMIGCVPQTVYPLVEDTVSQIEQPSEEIGQVPIEEATHSAVTKEGLLESVKGTSLEEGFKRILLAKETVDEGTLSELMCYALGYGPVYNQKAKEQSPYSHRLEIEKLWPLFTQQPEGTYEMAEWLSVYEKLIVPTLQSGQKIPQGGKGSYFEAIPLDVLGVSQMQVAVGEVIYPLYQLGNTNYISFSTLEQLGFSMTYSPQGGHVLERPYSILINEVYAEKALGKEKAKMYTESIQIGNVRTYGIKQNNELYVPVRSLNDYFELQIAENTCFLDLRGNATKDFVSVEANRLINHTDDYLDVKVAHYFWDGKAIKEEQVEVKGLAPQETYPLRESLYSENKEIMHYSTVVYEVKAQGVVEHPILFESRANAYGQMDDALFKRYEVNQHPPKPVDLDKLFPETKIIGTMKYATNGLQKGEKVEVWRADDGSTYHVKKNGKVIKVPWGSVSIPANPPVQKERASKEMLEMFVNTKGYTSDTKYLVWTDLSRQLTYVFERKNNQWVLIRTMLCTTGNNKTPTPYGTYKLRAYVPYFGLEKGYRCKNAVQIEGDYLYHSVMFNKAGTYVLGGQVLGKQGSHGCIRLSPEDSEWFYRTMPLKTQVIIR